MLKTLYERVTGRPWRTVRSMAAEFGPTPATRHPELLAFTDAQLLAYGQTLVAVLRRAKTDPVAAEQPCGDWCPDEVAEDCDPYVCLCECHTYPAQNVSRPVVSVVAGVGR